MIYLIYLIFLIYIYIYVWYLWYIYIYMIFIYIYIYDIYIYDIYIYIWYIYIYICDIYIYDIYIYMIYIYIEDIIKRKPWLPDIPMFLFCLVSHLYLCWPPLAASLAGHADGPLPGALAPGRGRDAPRRAAEQLPAPQLPALRHAARHAACGGLAQRAWDVTIWLWLTVCHGESTN